MKKFLAFLLVLSLVSLCVMSATANGRQVITPYAATRFATLPDGAPFPEGITANPYTGQIYVGTFIFGEGNVLLRYGRNGKLEAQKPFGGTPLLGLAYNESDEKVYLANFGASQIQRIDAEFDDSSVVEVVAVIPGIGAPADSVVGNPDGSTDTIQFGSNFFPGPNGLTFNSNGDLYFSDSFQGAIFLIEGAADCSSCDVNLLIHDPLLATAGFPPFGANGLALNADETSLFVANTGDDRILRIDDLAGDITVSVFSESINGADGIAFDYKGILWVAANQADQVVGLNNEGRVIAELGEFLGIRKNGAVSGLIFPASLVIVGHETFVTNLALPLTGAVGDEAEEEISTYTVSRIRIPHRLDH